MLEILLLTLQNHDLRIKITIKININFQNLCIPFFKSKLNDIYQSSNILAKSYR